MFESPNPNSQDQAQINQVFVLPKGSEDWTSGQLQHEQKELVLSKELMEEWELPELNPEEEAPVRNTLFNLGRTRSELREVADG